MIQVCLSGHRITDSAACNPHFRKAFCRRCGTKTITACTHSQASIQGCHDASDLVPIAIREPIVPNNCHACGTAYPWRQDGLAAAVEDPKIRIESRDAREAAALVAAVSVYSPRTELVPMKLRKLLSKLPKATYGVAIKVIGDAAAAACLSGIALPEDLRPIAERTPARAAA